MKKTTTTITKTATEPKKGVNIGEKQIVILVQIIYLYTFSSQKMYLKV